MVKVRYFFTFLVIIYMTGINIFPNNTISMNSADVIKGNETTQTIAAAIYLIVVCMLIARLKYVVRLSVNNILIWPIIIWVFASFLWSAEPSLTLRRAVGLFGTTMIGLYIAAYYKYEQFIRITCWSFLIISLLSLAVIVFYPSQGIMPDPYGWKGIFYHKNGLGMFALFGVTLFPAFLRRKASYIPWKLGFILSCILLFGSNSTTALILSAFAVISWSIILAYRSRFEIGFIILVISISIIFVIGVWIYLTNNIDLVFNALGKDTTLTGRTFLWNLSLHAVRQNPWLGYGFGAFWLGKDYGPASYFMGNYAYFLNSSHNGYLELLLEIGIVGEILVIIVIIGIFYKLFNNFRNSIITDNYQIWPVVFLITYILYNVIETDLLIQNNIAWIFITTFWFSNFKMADAN